MKTSSLIKIGAGFIVLFLIVIQFFDTDKNIAQFLKMQLKNIIRYPPMYRAY
jgi:hypothetical protein